MLYKWKFIKFCLERKVYEVAYVFFQVMIKWLKDERLVQIVAICVINSKRVVYITCINAVETDTNPTVYIHSGTH